METKTIKVEQLKFTITKLGAIEQLKLIREICKLMADTKLIKSLVMQQLIQNVLRTGVEVDGVSQTELQAIAQVDTAELIANLSSSIINGLDDTSMDYLIAKCLDKVMFHNGILDTRVMDALEMGQISDVVVLLSLLKEVLTFNFAGVLERAKKLNLIPGSEATKG